MTKKILLALLPFWTPQVPPLGISCLKRFIEPHGFRVKTVDINIEEDLRKNYNNYFDTLRSTVSEHKQGNFYNVGHDVLQNHMMAYLNYKEENHYIQLVKTLVFKTFFSNPDTQQVMELHGVIAEFYHWLEHYFIDLLEQEEPDVLGLSVYKGNLPASLFAFQLTREKFPGINTVMGGAVFAQTLVKGTPDFDYFLEKTRSYIDKMIIGEGEILFLKLLEGKLPGARRVYTIKDINNEILDLSSPAAAEPDFSDLELGYYPNLAAYSSRSCPYQCSFCTETVYWGPYRKKKAGKVVDELERLHQRFGSQLFLMCDSLLNPIITDLAAEMLHRGLSLYWDGYLRIDNSAGDKHMTLQWRRGGFYRARLGIESGSQQLLDTMGKHIRIQQIKAAVSALAHAGIKTTTYWIIGYPGETEEDFQQTLHLIEELKDDIYEAEGNPFGYYLHGQVESQQWAKKYNSIALYPPTDREMLILQTYILDCQPSRPETYERLLRYVNHCNQLGIPNPYSLYDIHQADERWKKLHKNAVPPLVKFTEGGFHLDENRQVKELLSAKKSINQGDITFGF